MRERLLIIALSVAAVGLCGGIVALKRSRGSASASAANEPSAPNAAAAQIRYKVIKEQPGTHPQSAPLFHWREVESADYKDYIAKLRNIYCPEETIRDIIIADVNKLYAPREAALKVSGDEEASVSDDRVRRVAPFERRKQLREIQKEKNALLKELLGIELPLDPLRARGDRNYELFEAAFKSLPAEKRELVREIQETYWQTSDNLKDKYANKRTAEYIEEYKRANLERKAQLANVLTPDELDEYEMRTTNVAQNMQSSLEGFNPSEDEFKTIYRIRKAIEEPYGGLLGAGAALDAQGNVLAQDQRSYADRRQQINDKIKETLGPERAREYELSQDYNYRSLRQLGDRFGLAPEVVTQSYELQRNYRDQQRQLRSDRTLTSEQRNAALQELSTSHQTQFTQLVGERAAKAFQNNRGGFVENGGVVAYE
jgi:hypothetical protein